MADQRFPRTIKGVFYPTRQTYLDALARRRGYPSYAYLRAAPVAARKARALSGLRAVSRRGALSAINVARTKRVSLTRAAREAGVSVATVKRYAHRALERRGRRLDVKAYDKLPRTLRVLTPEGQISVEVRDSRTASRIGEYWDAVRHYVATGDTSRLRPFRGKFFFAQKRGYRFVTETAVLDRLAYAGELHFEDLYDNGMAA
jgi:hypothetical protein